MTLSGIYKFKLAWYKYMYGYVSYNSSTYLHMYIASKVWPEPLVGRIVSYYWKWTLIHFKIQLCALVFSTVTGTCFSLSMVYCLSF